MGNAGQGWVSGRKITGVIMQSQVEVRQLLCVRGEGQLGCPVVDPPAKNLLRGKPVREHCINKADAIHFHVSNQTTPPQVCLLTLIRHVPKPTPNPSACSPTVQPEAQRPCLHAKPYICGVQWCGCKQWVLCAGDVRQVQVAPGEQLGLFVGSGVVWWIGYHVRGLREQRQAGGHSPQCPPLPAPQGGATAFTKGISFLDAAGVIAEPGTVALSKWSWGHQVSFQLVWLGLLHAATPCFGSPVPCTHAEVPSKREVVCHPASSRAELPPSLLSFTTALQRHATIP